MSLILRALTRLPMMARLALGLALGLGLVSLYVTMQARGNPQAASATAGACSPARDVTAAINAAATGELAAFKSMTPRIVPDLRFNDPAGAPINLSQMQGRMVLLNLWATWCAPCRHEMPALDALQAEFGGPAFEVVAVNIDTRNLDKPRQWLADNNITRLAYYADPEARVFQELKRAGQAVGMPTTLLIDAKGCQLGVLHGPAAWASDDARRLIRAALGR
jgi:thiol-disulfide isomerase/thioredoxin